MDNILMQHPMFKSPVSPVKLSDFLQALYAPIYDEEVNSPYYIEICSIARNNYGSTYMDTKSFRNTIANFDKIRNQVRLFNLYNCTFFTVCPRDKKYIEARTGRVHRTSRSDVTVGTVLWLDFDLDLLDDDVEKANEIALNTISQLNPFPNIIVKTPGGYHVYFLLDQVYPVEEISYTNRRLQKWTKADNCGDPVRIMRIPMGKHHK